MELQEKVRRVQEFRLMDDVFFEVFAKDIPACQEILRTILEDDGLIVEEVIVQSSERNLYGRSVRLDALCTLGNGSKCNIEVQRSDRDNHMKRARFNASVITTRSAKPGETKRFRELKSEGGASAVCEVMEKYLEEASAEAKKAERIQAIQKMIALSFPKDKILKMYSEEEYQEAEAGLDKPPAMV